MNHKRRRAPAKRGLRCCDHGLRKVQSRRAFRQTFSAAGLRLAARACEAA